MRGRIVLKNLQNIISYAKKENGNREKEMSFFGFFQEQEGGEKQTSKSNYLRNRVHNSGLGRNGSLSEVIPILEVNDHNLLLPILFAAHSDISIALHGTRTKLNRCLWNTH